MLKRLAIVNDSCYKNRPYRAWLAACLAGACTRCNDVWQCIPVPSADTDIVRFFLRSEPTLSCLVIAREVRFTNIKNIPRFYSTRYYAKPAEAAVTHCNERKHKTLHGRRRLLGRCLAALVNTQTHTQTDINWPAVLLAQPPSKMKNRCRKRQAKWLWNDGAYFNDNTVGSVHVFVKWHLYLFI